MSKTSIEFFQNSNPRDSTNLVQYLKSTFLPNDKNSIKFDTYDKNNFYMFFKAITTIELKSLNDYLNQFEYFIEPVELEFYFCQLIKRMRPNIELFIDKMLNINVSLNFAKILQFTIKKFTLNKEEIKKQKEKEKLDGNEITVNNFDIPRYIGYEAPTLILENYTGVDMEIWFDNVDYDLNDKNMIIKIKSNEKYELTMNLLNKYKVKKMNNNLDSTISYKFCLEENFINRMNISKNTLIGNSFNINYHHLYIHDISNIVKVSVESCSDNLLIRHAIFSSLITLKNETKFQNLEMFNGTEKIILSNKKKQAVPISWLLDRANRSLNLIHNSSKVLLMRDMNDISNMCRVVKFNNGNTIMIDMVRYKFNLEEYYTNKNIINKEEIKENIFRIDLIITSPIYFLNNTPYDFIINSSEKILSAKSLSSYSKNSELFLKYRQTINEKEKKKLITKYEIIMKILKEIKFQIIYNNEYILANTYITEKEEMDEDKSEEGKNITNVSLYNKSLLILLKNNNSKEYLICRLLLNNPYKTLNFNDKIFREMNIELNSFRFEIIFDYYFVNKTMNNLFFNNESLKIVPNSKENIFIPSKQLIPVAKVQLDNKIKFRKIQKEWTEYFEYTALGKEFVLNVKNSDKTYNAISVMAKVSTTFKKSILFTLEEKFFIINDLPFDIYIKEEKLNTLIKYRSKEANVLLLDKKTLEKKSRFRIGIDACFSHIFDVSKLGSYDLLIKYDQKTFQKYNINTSKKLVEYNYVKYFPIRCVINTINKNTIYIIFSLNNQYINQLKNCTPQTIQIYVNENKKCKFTVRPEEAIPLVYINNKNDKYKPVDKVEIIFNEEKSIKVNISEIDTKFCGKYKNYIIRIRPEKNNSVKSIVLYGKTDKRLSDELWIKKKNKKIFCISRNENGAKFRRYWFKSY